MSQVSGGSESGQTDHRPQSRGQLGEARAVTVNSSIEDPRRRRAGAVCLQPGRCHRQSEMETTMEVQNHAERMGTQLDLQLTGKRALVTGAASGIGLAIARDLAWRGADVLLADLPGDRLASTAAELDARGIGVDLSCRVDVLRLVSEVDPVQILVNNAGLQYVSPVEDFPEES